MKKLKNIFDNKGFTLIESMVGLGMITVSVMMFMRISDSAQVARRLSRESEQYAAITNRIQSFISEPQLCRLAFGGPILDDTNDIAAIQNDLATGAGAVTNIKIYEPQAVGASRPVYLQTGMVVGSWEVMSLDVRALDGQVNSNSDNEALSLTLILRKNEGDIDVTSYEIRFLARVGPSGRLRGCQNLKHVDADDYEPIPTCPAGQSYFTGKGGDVGCRVTQCPVDNPRVTAIDAATGVVSCGP